jgi:hypothetical protein
VIQFPHEAVVVTWHSFLTAGDDDEGEGEDDEGDEGEFYGYS